MDSVNIHIASRLQQRSDFAALVDSVQDIVQEEINLATASATWDCVRDSWGRDVISLHVYGNLGAEATATFAPEELRNESHLRTRLHQLLGVALRVNAWRTALEELYTQVTAWLRTLDASAFCQRYELELNEQESGPYRAEAVRFHLHGDELRLEPVAAFVVGADGRAELIGPSDRFTLLRSNGAWFWLNDRELGDLLPLTEERFGELIGACVQ